MRTFASEWRVGDHGGLPAKKNQRNASAPGAGVGVVKVTRSLGGSRGTSIGATLPVPETLVPMDFRSWADSSSDRRGTNFAGRTATCTFVSADPHAVRATLSPVLRSSASRSCFEIRTSPADGCCGTSAADITAKSWATASKITSGGV